MATVGRVLGTEDATPLEFWVAIGPDGRTSSSTTSWPWSASLPDGRTGAHLRRGQPGPGPPRGRPLRLRRVPHRGRGAARPRSVEAAQVMTTRFEPEVFVPPLPGTAVRPGRGRGARPGPVLRPMDRRAARRARPRRRAPLPQPRLPRRHPRRPRQHLGHLGRGHQDQLRHVPAVQPVPLGRARRRGGQHQGPDLQREGRGPALPRPREHPAGRDGARRSTPELDLPVGAFRERGRLRPAPARRPDGGARRVQPAGGVTSFFWTLEEFCADELLPVPLRRRRGRAPAVHDGRAQRHGTPRGATPRPRATGRCASTATRSAPSATWSSSSSTASQDEDDGRPRGPARPSARARSTPSSAGCTASHAATSTASIRADVPDAEAPPGRRRARRSRSSTCTTSTTGPSASWSASCCAGPSTRRSAPGHARPLLFVVLDELNKYAPRDGASRSRRSSSTWPSGAGRSASSSSARSRRPARWSGASSPTRAIRVVGRLDAGGGVAGRVRLPARRSSGTGPRSSSRARCSSPSPSCRCPLVVEFPFPAWATRLSRSRRQPAGHGEQRRRPLRGALSR